jgi:hypothetical protein
VIRKLIVLYLLAIPATIEAQIKKLHCYKQELYGGAMQANDTVADKSGNEKTVRPANTRYFLFAEIEKKKRIVVLQLWINKKLYNFTIDTVKQFPHILLSSSGGESISRDTLVTSTQGYVIQLKNPIPAGQRSMSVNLQKIVSQNNIVLIYLYCNKKQSISLKKFKELPAIFAP